MIHAIESDSNRIFESIFIRSTIRSSLGIALGPRGRELPENIDRWFAIGHCGSIEDHDTIIIGICDVYAVMCPVEADTRRIRDDVLCESLCNVPISW
jgi:hypothetical protein